MLECRLKLSNIEMNKNILTLVEHTIKSINIMTPLNGSFNYIRIIKSYQIFVTKSIKTQHLWSTNITTNIINQEQIL